MMTLQRSKAMAQGFAAQIERVAQKNPKPRVILFEASYTGDDSDVTLTWVERQINNLLTQHMGMTVRLADDPVRYARTEGDAGDNMQVTALKRKLAEAQLYIESLENWRADEQGEDEQVHYLNATHFAQACNVSASTIVRAIARGDIEAHKDDTGRWQIDSRQHYTPKRK